MYFINYVCMTKMTLMFLLLLSYKNARVCRFTDTWADSVNREHATHARTQTRVHIFPNTANNNQKLNENRVKSSTNRLIKNAII